MSKNTKNYQLYTFTSDNDVADLKLLEHSFDVIDKGLVLDVGESTGIGNNYVLNLGGITLTSANKGISFKFWADKNASGVCKINGTYNLVKSNGNAVTNLKAGAPYTITYDGGTNFFLASSSGGDDVNFSASDLLSGKTANNSDGEIVTGTMPNKGAITATLNCGGSYTIPAGYHNGSGKVTANSLASQTGANATAGDILTGKTAWINGSKITGTMPNNGAVTTSLNCGGSYTIPAGYHNGSGKVTANSLASQTSANATAGDILVDKTAWINGTKVTGTIPNRGEYQIAGGIGFGDDYVAFNKIPHGYYPQSGNGWSPEIRAKKTDVAAALGLTANKIVSGSTICGIAGTVTIESLGGARKFIKRITVNEIKGQPDKHTINVGFRPRFVLCWVVTPGNFHAQVLQLYSTDINGLQSGAWIQGHGSSSSGYWPKCKITGLHDNGFYYGDGKNTISQDDTFQMDIIAIG